MSILTIIILLVYTTGTLSVFIIQIVGIKCLVTL
jgi:hypothetical protein